MEKDANEWTGRIIRILGNYDHKVHDYDTPRNKKHSEYLLGMSIR